MTFAEELMHRLSQGQHLQYKQVIDYAGSNRATESPLRWKVTHGESDHMDLWGGRTFELSI